MTLSAKSAKMSGAKPAAHRNVAQEDAENALYAEGTAIVNDFCKRTGNLRKAKEAMNAALRMKSEKSCSWELVDLNNPDELEQMTSSSMKNEASPEIHGAKKTVIRSRFVRVILAQGPC